MNSELLNCGDQSIETLLDFQTSPKSKVRKIVEKPNFDTKYESSELQDRLKSFLPELEQANKRLSKEVASDPLKYDINYVDNEEKPHVNMDMMWMFDVLNSEQENKLQH